MIRSARQAMALRRPALVLVILLGFGAARLPLEHKLFAEHQRLHFRQVEFNLNLREQIGQLGFVAALSGFRSLVADALFIRAHVAWERTEWGRVLLLFRQVTTLQPRSVLFWDMAAWHMGWNASVAALNDPTQPRQALRVKAQREYFALGKDFLERGIRNNPEKPQLYESLARLYKDKYNDHARASEYFGKAAALPGAPSYDRRFAAYELSYTEGRHREAYEELRRLYDLGENERLPTLLNRLKFLENKLNIPPDQRIPEKALQAP
jgi:tetratricopeptide (TPR) repeat protein